MHSGSNFLPLQGHIGDVGEGMDEAAFIVQPRPVGLQWSAVNPLMLTVVLLSLLFIPLNAAAQINRLDERLEQAAALLRGNRIAEAEQQLNSILKVAPQEARALNLLGTIRASQGKLDEAETLFARAVRLDPQLVGAHMNLAYLYLLKGAPEKTIAELNAVLSLDPNNPEALYKLARLLLSQGHLDDCIKVIEKSPLSQSSAFLVVLGDAYLRKDDADKAEASYRLALNNQADAADALLGLTQVSQLRGDQKTAALYLSRAKELVGNAPDLLYRYALAALKSGRYEEAQLALEQAVKLRPDEPAYFIALGATWLKKPDLYEAEQAFRHALQLHPGSAQGQMYLGYTLLKQKKYPEARAYLEKSLQADQSMPEAFYYLGLIAQEQNEDERAVGVLEKLVERFPAFVNANVHIALGSSYLKLKNYARAKQELELGVKLNPDEPKAHYNLALLYARLKDPQRAQEEMQIVEKLKQSNGQAKENEVISPASPRPR